MEIAILRTRGGIAQATRWQSCVPALFPQAVHIENVEQMSFSSFINALRRLIAINSYKRSHERTLVISTDCLGIHAVNAEDGPIKMCFWTKGLFLFSFYPIHPIWVAYRSE